jgi:hypothetical protein
MPPVIDDPLKALLEEADVAPLASCTSPLKLASETRALYRRRSRRNRVIATTGVVFVGFLFWLGIHSLHKGEWLQPRKDLPSTAALNSAVSPTDLGQAMKDIVREQRIVEQLFVAERRHRLAMTAQKLEISPEPRARNDEQVGRAALAILLPADQKRLRPELQTSAREDYTSVIGLFPHTQWAESAQQRLAGLPH